VNLHLTAAIADVLGSPITDARPVRGGDINDAYAVDLADGRRVFVKTHTRPVPGMYRCEHAGLEWLDEAQALRVPQRYAAHDDESGAAFLALEWIEPGTPAADFDEHLGRGLAHLHRKGAEGFGLAYDNFIGSLPQHNTPAATWAEFYGQCRLLPQFERATAGGIMPHEVRTGLEHLLARLPEFVGAPEPAARLHGDLWNGNVHCDAAGQPCLIDPAVYGGHREVDLAMLQLFGLPGPRFFAAYDEAYPLARDWQQRVPLYQLYPLLVHANLFGASYIARVRRCVAEILR